MNERNLIAAMSSMTQEDRETLILETGGEELKGRQKRRIYRSILQGTGTRHKWGRRLMAAAACICAVAVCCAAIPPVRAVIAKWWESMATTTGEYLAEPNESRAAAIPAIDEAIQTQEKTASATVEVLDENWREWAEGLDVTVDSIIVDDSSVYVSGEMYGRAKEILCQYSGEGSKFQLTSDAQSGWIEARAGLAIENILMTMPIVTVPEEYFNRFSLPPEEDVYAEETAAEFQALECVPFSSEHWLESSTKEKISGVYSGVYIIEFGETVLESTDSQGMTHSFAPRVRMSIPISFDTAQAAAKGGVLPLKSTTAAFGGEASALISDGEYSENRTICLDGATLRADSIEYGIGETVMTLRIKTPDDMTAEEAEALLSQLWFTVKLDGTKAEELFQGTSGAKKVADGEYEVRLISSVANMEEILHKAKKVEIGAELEIYDTMFGVNLPKDEKVVIPDVGGGNVESHRQEVLREPLVISFKR